MGAGMIISWEHRATGIQSREVYLGTIACSLTGRTTDYAGQLELADALWDYRLRSKMVARYGLLLSVALFQGVFADNGPYAQCKNSLFWYLTEWN